MVVSFSLDYFLLVLVAALGVLQMVASHPDFRGLLLVRPPAVAFLGGLCAVIAAFVWFFAAEARNLSDTEGGLDGNRAASIFCLATSIAVAATFIFSSVVNRSLGREGPPPSPGLDALRHTTYLRALWGSLKALWKRY